MIMSCHSRFNVANRADQPEMRTDKLGYFSGSSCASRNRSLFTTSICRKIPPGGIETPFLNPFFDFPTYSPVSDP